MGINSLRHVSREDLRGSRRFLAQLLVEGETVTSSGCISVELICRSRMGLRVREYLEQASLNVEGSTVKFELSIASSDIPILASCLTED